MELCFLDLQKKIYVAGEGRMGTRVSEEEREERRSTYSCV